MTTISMASCLPRRAVLAVLGIALGAIGLAPTGAHAYISTCRSDPLVYLSNGKFVDLTASIATNASMVKSVTYTLRAPAGTRVIKIYHTPSALRSVERFYFTAGNPVATYDTIIKVTTARKNVSVTTTAWLANSPNNRVLAYASTRTLTGHAVTNHFFEPNE